MLRVSLFCRHRTPRSLEATARYANGPQGFGVRNIVQGPASDNRHAASRSRELNERFRDSDLNQAVVRNARRLQDFLDDGMLGAGINDEWFLGQSRRAYMFLSRKRMILVNDGEELVLEQVVGCKSGVELRITHDGEINVARRQRVVGSIAWLSALYGTRVLVTRGRWRTASGKVQPCETAAS